MRIGWLDTSSGISGDMLLGTCVDAGVPLEVVQGAIDRLGLPERVTLVAHEVVRAGLGATKVRVEAPESHQDRRLGDILGLLERLDRPLREVAGTVFRSLAEAESGVHRVSPEEVHFHEVGALDSIADVVGVAAAVRHLELDRLVCGPIAVGGGRAGTAHGSIPVPAPAVVELLRRGEVPAMGGPLDRELATPTGVALAVALADGFGPMPPLVPAFTGTGAGSWDPAHHANVLRLVVGAPVERASIPAVQPACLLEANVDDLDPRLWPRVLTALLEGGADDAWLTPIVMKKGRPAHVVSVLGPPHLADPLGRILLTHTSTIGLRRREVEKLPLPRECVEVDVLGSPVRVKVARLAGATVNVSPEYDDIARVAVEHDLPEKAVLAAAVHAAHELWGRGKE